MTEIDLTPITRLEYDIDAILNDHAVAEPITRIELILADIVAGNTTTVEPVTRIETYLAIISGADYPVPEPVTRIETFLAIIAGEDYEEPEAVTRLEGLLAEWVEKGSGIWKTVTGTLLHLTDALASPMQKCEVTLEPIQDLHGQDAPYPAGGGKNKLQNLQTTQTISGVTFTVCDDGSVNVNGTATELIVFTLNDVLGQYLENGTAYILSGSPINSDTSKWKFRVYNVGDNVDAGNGVTFTYSNAMENQKCDIVVYSGTTMSNVLIKPMIRLASVSDDTFAPYSNICPITGWTGATLYRTGTNICDLADAGIATKSLYNLSSGTISIGGSGAILSGTNPIEITNTTTWRGAVFFSKPLKAGRSCKIRYRIKGNNNGNIKRTYYVVNKSNTIVKKESRFSGVDNNETFVYAYEATALSDGDKVVFAVESSSAQTITIYDLAINYPSTDTDYAPYSGTTLSVTFPDSAGTVYGGTVDLVSGVLTSNMVYFDPYDYLNYFQQGNGNVYMSATYFLNFGIKHPINTNRCKCNILKPLSASSPSTPSFSISSSATFAVNGATGITDTLENWKAYVTNNHESNPVYFVLELATPITVQLTPQEISTLLGENNIWADVNGDITLIYKAQAS